MESALASPRGFLPGPRPLWSRARGPTTLARVTTRLRFGSCLIDLATRELSDDGRLSTLSPRVFDCLAYLLEHRDRAVGRVELMAAVWGRADVSDSQLAQVMLKARRAVGDSGDAQRVIRTVAGFGYHWIAPVEPIVDVAQRAPVAEPAAARTRPRNAGAWRQPLLWSSLLLLAGLVAFAGWRARDDAGARQPSPAAAAGPLHEHGIAVLAAEVDASGEWSWLRLGAMEFVAARLRAAGHLVAPSENVVSVMHGDDGAALLSASVRRALDPRWLVQPRLRRVDAGWVAELELLGRTGAPRAFNAPAADALAALAAVTLQLEAELGAAPPGGTPPASVEGALARIDAALLVDDLESARRALRTAADAERALPELRLRDAEILFLSGRLAEAAAALVALRGDTGEAASALRARIASLLGAVRVRQGDAAQAERDTGDAIALLQDRGEPASLGKAHMRRGVARALLRRHDEALADFAQARIAMQLAGDALALAQIELNEGALNGVRNHPADALASFERAEQGFARFGVSSELANALANQVVAHRVLLQPDGALRASERSLALLGRLADPASVHLVELRRAQALADVGRWSEADATFAELLRAIDARREPEVAAMAGNERARIALARADAERALALVVPVVADLTEPAFESTRAEAWFIAIRALHALGRDDEATTATTAFANWAGQAGNSTFVIHAKLAQAEHAVAQGRFELADRLYAEALSDANRQNVPADIAEVAISQANALIARGELALATTVAGQLDRHAADHFGSALLQARLYRALGRGEAWRAALDRARILAGERAIPAEVASPPGAAPIGRAEDAGG